MRRTGVAVLVAACAMAIPCSQAAEKKTSGDKNNPAKQLITRFDRDGDSALNLAELTQALVLGRQIIAPSPAKTAGGKQSARGRRTVAAAGPVRMVQGRRGAVGRPVLPAPTNPLAQAQSLVGVAIGQTAALGRAMQGPPSP